jgi:hypothetical protein
VLAALGLYMSQSLGMPVFDGIASMAIGVVLIATAVMLGRESRGLLLGMAAPLRVRTRSRPRSPEFPEVRAVLALLTMQIGPESLLVTGEINVKDDMRTDEIEALLADPRPHPRGRARGPQHLSRAAPGPRLTPAVTPGPARSVLGLRLQPRQHPEVLERRGVPCRRPPRRDLF